MSDTVPIGQILIVELKNMLTIATELISLITIGFSSFAYK